MQTSGGMRRENREVVAIVRIGWSEAIPINARMRACDGYRCARNPSYKTTKQKRRGMTPPSSDQ